MTSDVGTPSRVAIWALLGIFALPLVPWITFALGSVMLFDAPGSERNWILVAFTAIGLLYPLWYGVSVRRAVQALRTGHGKAGILWASMPVLVFVTMGGLYLLLMVRCDGQFVC